MKMYSSISALGFCFTKIYIIVMQIEPSCNKWFHISPLISFDITPIFFSWNKFHWDNYKTNYLRLKTKSSVYQLNFLEIFLNASSDTWYSNVYFILGQEIIWFNPSAIIIIWDADKNTPAEYSTKGKSAISFCVLLKCACSDHFWDLPSKLRLWYQKKAHIFLIICVKFQAKVMLRSEYMSVKVVNYLKFCIQNGQVSINSLLFRFYLF